jgi:tetratricopeptide (TPR) repeat protein
MGGKLVRKADGKRPKRAEPRGHPRPPGLIMGTLGPELVFVAAVMAAVGALSASRQGRRDIVATWRRGHAAFAADRFDEAEQCFLLTLAIAEQRFGPDHWRTALHVNALAQALVGQRRLDDAAPLVDRALGIVERWSRMPHAEAASVILGAATFQSALGRHARAMALVDRARRATKNELSMRATIERTVARLEAVAGHDAEAADALARIPFEQLEPRDVRALATFGVACLRDGDPERAVRCFTSAHALVERESPGEFAEAFYLGLLGEVLARCGRDEEARRALEQAVIDYDAVLGEHHPASAALLVELAEVRLRLGDSAGARIACERVVAMRTISGAPSEEPYRTSAATGDPLGLERHRAHALLARARRG